MNILKRRLLVSIAALMLTSCSGNIQPSRVVVQTVVVRETVIVTAAPPSSKTSAENTDTTPVTTMDIGGGFTLDEVKWIDYGKDQYFLVGHFTYKNISGGNARPTVGECEFTTDTGNIYGGSYIINAKGLDMFDGQKIADGATAQGWATLARMGEGVKGLAVKVTCMARANSDKSEIANKKFVLETLPSPR